MRRVAWLTSGVIALAMFVFAPLAAADTVTALSAPNGDIGATSSSGSLTDKDHDGDFNTLTQADRLGLFWSVANNAPTAQTIHITVVLDGPGTSRDATLVDEDRLFGPWMPVGGSTIEQDFSEVQVKHKDWPEGTYSLSVTGSGSESVTATSSFTIRY
jgi:hypothetical protein